MFTKAIVKTPCPAVTEGITSAPELGKPDYQKALRQHAAYVEALRRCGVSVTVLPPDNEYPDSCFVEDVAVLTPKCAIVTNPGAATRNGEPAAIVPVLEQFYDKTNLCYITAPGTLEGGDVMMVGDTFYVGESARTNAAGIAQFGKILGQYGYRCVAVPLEKVLHLKTGVDYLENGNLLVSGEFCTKPCFAQYHKTEIPADEAYAANCIWMNGAVLVPAGFPAVKAAVEGLGYPVLTVDASEFRKIDGGLSCLSLRF